MPDERSRLVYSTDGEQIVSHKPPAPARGARAQPQQGRSAPPADRIVRIAREKSGRRGKTVTVVHGLPGGAGDLDALLKVLKQHCGAGGTRVDGVLELQGDHREQVRARLEALGHTVKLAGG